jgi:recombination protein RecT
VPRRGSTTSTAVLAPDTALEERRTQEQHPIIKAIQQRLPAIARVLPRSMDPERFQGIVLHALIQNPELLECTPASILDSVLQAAREGLEPTGGIGGAWLVGFNTNTGTRENPRWEKRAQLIRDYRGLSRMAIRSGAASKIAAHPVRDGDFFEYELGTDPKIVHRPLIGNNAEAHTFYAIAWLPDGAQQAEVMTRAQVEHIRGKSKSWNAERPSGPWHTDFDQMARKTVIKRLVNYLPLSPETRAQLQAEEAAEFGDTMAPVIRVAAVAQHGDLRDRAAQRAQLLAGSTEQPEQEEPQEGTAEKGTTPAPASPDAEPPTAADEPTAEPTVEPDLTLEEATMSVFAAAKEHKLIGPPLVTEQQVRAAWVLLDGLAAKAIPGTPLQELAVADWLAVRERINAGEWDPPAARQAATR